MAPFKPPAGLRIAGPFCCEPQISGELKSSLKDNNNMQSSGPSLQRCCMSAMSMKGRMLLSLQSLAASKSGRPAATSASRVALFTASDGARPSRLRSPKRISRITPVYRSCSTGRANPAARKKRCQRCQQRSSSKRRASRFALSQVIHGVTGCLNPHGGPELVILQLWPSSGGHL